MASAQYIVNIIGNVYSIKRPIATSRWCRHLWLLKRSIQNFLSIRMAESPRSTILHTLYAYFILYNSMFISLSTIFNPIWRQIKLVQWVLIPWQSNSKFSITVLCSDLVLRVIVHYNNIHYISGLVPQNFGMLQTFIHGIAPFQVKGRDVVGWEVVIRGFVSPANTLNHTHDEHVVFPSGTGEFRRRLEWLEQCEGCRNKGRRWVFFITLVPNGVSTVVLFGS